VLHMPLLHNHWHNIFPVNKSILLH
jgi:hypothetical protein